LSRRALPDLPGKVSSSPPLFAALPLSEDPSFFIVLKFVRSFVRHCFLPFRAYFFPFQHRSHFIRFFLDWFRCTLIFLTSTAEKPSHLCSPKNVRCCPVSSRVPSPHLLGPIHQPPSPPEASADTHAGLYTSSGPSPAGKLEVPNWSGARLQRGSPYLPPLCPKDVNRPLRTLSFSPPPLSCLSHPLLSDSLFPFQPSSTFHLPLSPTP